LGKLIMGIFPGILKLKNNFRNIFGGKILKGEKM
jgi:hypothetical protein